MLALPEIPAEPPPLTAPAVELPATALLPATEELPPLDVPPEGAPALGAPAVPLGGTSPESEQDKSDAQLASSTPQRRRFFIQISPDREK